MVEGFPGAERVTAAAVKGPGVNTYPKDGAWVGNMTHNGAWAFRTWWGHPVVFKLTAVRVGAKGSNAQLKGVWVGRVEVATSSAEAVQNIRKSWAHVVSWLTFGVYETVDNAFDPMNTRFVTENYDKVKLNPSEHNTVAHLPANGVEQWMQLQVRFC
jgi:hypothetical protein